MRKRTVTIATIATMLLACLPALLPAQSDPNKVVKQVSEALSEGDSRSISDYSDGQVEIDTGSGAKMYSRDQSRFVMEAFFETHPPSGFKLTDSTVLESFCSASGRYTSVDATQDWDVFMQLRRTDERWALEELRISPGIPPDRTVRLPAPSLQQNR